MAKKEEIKTDTSENKTESTQDRICGIIMPISTIDNCSSEHWTEVKRIISEAINDAGYKPNLVSNADDIGIIQVVIEQSIENQRDYATVEIDPLFENDKNNKENEDDFIKNHESYNGVKIKELVNLTNK